MSDTTTIPTVQIKTPAEFRALVEKLNKDLPAEKKINVGDRGRLPMREVSRVLVTQQLAGKLKCIDTDYFPITAWAMGATVGTRKAKADVAYLITYKVLNKNGKEMPNTITLELTENQIRSYLPNVKGMISSAFATMAVALHKAKEGALLSDVNKYVVTSVERKELIEAVESNAETTDVAPKGDDTGDTPEDAQTDAETVETVADKADTPELVSA